MFWCCNSPGHQNAQDLTQRNWPVVIPMPIWRGLKAPGARFRAGGERLIQNGFYTLHPTCDGIIAGYDFALADSLGP